MLCAPVHQTEAHVGHFFESQVVSQIFKTYPPSPIKIPQQTNQTGEHMQFRYTILYVDDVTKTIEFYERAFGLDRKMIHECGDYSELATGDTILSFSSKALMKKIGKSPGDVNPSAPTFEIAFETEDVAKQLKRAVEAGATLVQEVEDMPWGQTTAYVRDINGFLVELCTAVRPPS